MRAGSAEAGYAVVVRVFGQFWRGLVEYVGRVAVGEEGAKSGQGRTRSGQGRPKSGPRAAKSGTRAAKSGPRAAKSDTKATLA